MSTSTSTPQKAIFAPGSDPSGAPSQAEQYLQGTLEKSALSPSPLTQFTTWYAAARDSQVHQPETVCISTASLPSGRVSSRMVYMKELDARGFVVYSNWGTSRKAADVASNKHASLCFWWREMERQVRVEGPVERLTDQESQVYFDTRARGSRIGAWASQQSAVLDDRSVLEGQVKDVEERFEGVEKVPVPHFWGGLRVLPEYIEFWQGRESRLHDRFAYRRVKGQPGEESAEGDWTVERLSP